MASPPEQRQARFAAAFRDGRVTDEATIALFPVKLRRRKGKFDIIRRDTGSTIRTTAEGVETIRLLQSGRTLGAAKHELGRRHGCDPREVDITALVDSLVQADFVSEIDGYPISASAPSLQGPLEALIWTYVLVPLALLVGRHAPLRVATRLPGLRIAPRYAYLLRRIRGNMRSAPLLRGEGDGFDRLVRDNYDCIGRMYLERLLLTELPPKHLERWLRERCTISGLDNLDRARASGRGAILVGFHIGSYSLIPYLVASRGYAVTHLSGTEAASDVAFNRRIAELRAAGQDCRLTCVGGALGVRALLQTIMRGETAMLLCDSGVAEGQGIEIRFLGRWLRATEGTAWLARRTGAPVLPVVITWQPDGSHHLSIEPELRVASSIDDSSYIRDITSAIHAVLERQILQAPAQWFKWKDLHEMSSPLVEIPGA